MNTEESHASPQSWSAPNVPPEPSREGLSRRSLFRGGAIAALVASGAIGGIAGSAITALGLPEDQAWPTPGQACRRGFPHSPIPT